MLSLKLLQTSSAPTKSKICLAWFLRILWAKSRTRAEVMLRRTLSHILTFCFAFSFECHVYIRMRIAWFPPLFKEEKIVLKNAETYSLSFSFWTITSWIHQSRSRISDHQKRRANGKTTNDDLNHIETMKNRHKDCFFWWFLVPCNLIFLRWHFGFLGLHHFKPNGSLGLLIVLVEWSRLGYKSLSVVWYYSH